LSLHEHGIDRFANVMRGSDLQEAHYAEVTIDLKLNHVRSESVHGEGIALSIVVERACRRIECFLNG
jgi:hypothetical protein